jgi:CheY-like chemotaxis protein
MEKMLSIYLIDDNEVDRLIGEILLERALGRVKISSFSYADQALKELSNKIIDKPQELPHLILLDLDMPLKDGWTFLDNYSRIIQNTHTPRPLIYILTASINPTDIEAAKEHPLVEDFLIKPFSIAAIEKIKNQTSSFEYSV